MHRVIPSNLSRLPSRRLLGSVLLGLWMTVGVVSTAHAQIDRLPHADTTSGNFFGVAVSIDGPRALVGASSEDGCGENAGAAYLFERDTTGAWNQVARLTGRAEEQEGAFAASVSLDGDRALITTWGDPSGGRYGGAAYLFERDAAGTWTQTARLTGSGGIKAGIFGGAAALDGDRAVVAASSYFRKGSGSVYLFERDAQTDQWHEAARFGDIDDFFISVDIQGDRVLVGQSKKGRRQEGAATLYTRDASGTWRLSATIRPPTSYDHGAFGSQVALDGDRALVAGYDEQLQLDFNIDRVVYVFEYDPATDTWNYRHIVDIGAVAFGTSVDLDGTTALIGRASEQEPGAAYVVRLR